MKILITGSKGQLGTELCKILKDGSSELGEIPQKLKRATVIETDVQGTAEQLDITNLKEVKVFLRRQQPDVVINCAAYTNVNGCETEQQAAFKVNSIGPRNLALACEEIGTKLIQVSTDYVFNGCGDTPFCEYDMVEPQSIYGKTKRLGEEYVMQFCTKYFIVRTAWLYGYVGNNFVKTIVRAAKKNGELKVVNDQFGNPTNAVDLAHHILKLAATHEYGIYHCTGEGICSWYDFACEIVKLSGVQAKVMPCTTAEYPTPAKRPAYSALQNAMLQATVGDQMRDWKTALMVFFKNWNGE